MLLGQDPDLDRNPDGRLACVCRAPSRIALPAWLSVAASVVTPPGPPALPPAPPTIIAPAATRPLRRPAIPVSSRARGAVSPAASPIIPADILVRAAATGRRARPLRHKVQLQDEIPGDGCLRVVLNRSAFNRSVRHGVPLLPCPANLAAPWVVSGEAYALQPLQESTNSLNSEQSLRVRSVARLRTG